jgi:hypothetical protein
LYDILTVEILDSSWYLQPVFQIWFDHEDLMLIKIIIDTDCKELIRSEPPLGITKTIMPYTQSLLIPKEPIMKMVLNFNSDIGKEAAEGLITAWLFNVLNNLKENKYKKIKANGIDIPNEIGEIKRIIGDIVNVF